jgi:hypothetical protein
MADATSEVTLELHGFLAERLSALGSRRGSRRLIAVSARPGEAVRDFMARLVLADARLGLLFDAGTAALPEHVEVVLNDRLLDLRGGLDAQLQTGDVLSFLPAHAGGSSLNVG